MKRDFRLRGLSSDHHHLLALATRLARAYAWTAADGAALRERFGAEIEPHFVAEETMLGELVQQAGNAALAERLRAEHAELRTWFERACAGEASALIPLSNLLIDHVRWEERELFPWCEANLTPAQLDRVAQAAPHVDRAPNQAPLATVPELDTTAVPSAPQLRALIPAFYTRVRQDDLLGPVFDAAVEDWPAHLDKLIAFWARAMLGTPGYGGNPMIAHRKHLDRITPAHFARWLALWAEVTAERLPAPVADALQQKARRMAHGLQGGLFGAG